MGHWNAIPSVEQMEFTPDSIIVATECQPGLMAKIASGQGLAELFRSGRKDAFLDFG